MQKNSPQNDIRNDLEKEIRDHLNQFQVADLVADFILKKYEDRKLLQVESDTLASFLMISGLYATLTDFFTRKIGDGSMIPWGHLAEALFRMAVAVPVNVKRALFEIAKKESRLSDLSRTNKLDHQDDSIAKARVEKQMAFQTLARKLRDELMGQREMLQSQGLVDDEEKLLIRLQKIFPKDDALAKLHLEFKQRRALDFIADPPLRMDKGEEEKVERPSEEELQELKQMLDSSKEVLKNHPELRDDLAVALLMTGYADGAAELAKDSGNFWLRAEILFRARRFVEVLDILGQFESQIQDQPELTYACLYMKAQALWGLRQKSQALEIMEGLYEVIPDYRVVSHVLQSWKESRS